MQNEIRQRTITVYSEGTRLAASLHEPLAAAPAAGRPGLLLCHGWGGLKSDLARYAALFAAAGFAVMTFDYRGWGESDGRIIATKDAPPLLEAGEREMRVRVLREIVDPVDQTTDVRNCLAVLADEPGVDASKLGIWGTSFGAGHAVFTAGHQPEIRAVFAQIGGFGLVPQYREHARLRRLQKARGLIDPVVPQNGLDGYGSLKGTPDVARMLGHSPLAAAANIRVPTFILDAEFEELNNRLEHGFAAYLIIRQQALCEYKTLPCQHYAVYDRYFEESTNMAKEWFQRHLQGA